MSEKDYFSYVQQSTEKAQFLDNSLTIKFSCLNKVVEEVFRKEIFGPLINMATSWWAPNTPRTSALKASVSFPIFDKYFDLE